MAETQSKTPAAAATNGSGILSAAANQAIVAPFRLAANMGLATANVAAEGASRAASMAAGAFGAGASLFPLGSVANMIKRASGSATTQPRDRGEVTTGKSGQASGAGAPVPANGRLADSIFDVAAKTAALPVPAATAIIEAAYEDPSIKRAVDDTILLLSSALDRYSARSIFPDSIVRVRNAKLRKATLEAVVGGPTAAVLRDFNGMVGGLAGFFLGDTGRLARGSRAFKSSMEYVFEKWLHGEVQPESDFPLRADLAATAVDVVERFPELFVQALERGNAAEIGNAYLAQMGDVNSFLLNYPKATYNVLSAAWTFVFGIFVEVEDGYAYPLNELAIFGSGLSNEDKDWAHEMLRKTAPKSIVDFEYYIPLLIDMDGHLSEKCYRRNAAGEIINDRMRTASIFPARSITLAQSIHAELSCLPSLIWLYGDEIVAREKNFEETTRKFGVAAAQRIADHPMFPLTSAEIDELTRSGPKTKQQVDETLDYALRVRGLAVVADGIKQGSFDPVWPALRQRDAEIDARAQAAV